jgi:HPt (histidine-containing phosphotransfer) domain-containing protein
MNDHIAKPIEPEALFRTLQQWHPAKPGLPGLRRRRVVTSLQSDDALELPALLGLDTTTGLRRVAGNRRLYRELLGKYMTGQAEAVTQIRAALACADWVTAERLAHILKGVSGNIGATAIQQLAGDLEQALREQRDSTKLESLLMQTGEALKTLMTDLCAVLDSAPPTPSAALTVNEDQLKPLLMRLEELLSDDDAEAVDYLATHRAILAEALPIEPFLAIEKAATDYRFEEALHRLRMVYSGPRKSDNNLM